MGFSGYGTYESLNEFKAEAEVGIYYISEELKTYVSEFYWQESAQVWTVWYAEEFYDASDDNPQGWEDAESSLMLGDHSFIEVDIGPFFAVLNFDVTEDPWNEDNEFGVYACSENYFETYLADVYDVVQVGDRKGQTYQTALEAARDMYNEIGDDNEYGIEVLRLYDVFTKGDESPIDKKELSVDQG